MTDFSIFTDEQLTAMEPEIAKRFDADARGGWLNLARSGHAQLLAVRAELERRAVASVHKAEAA